MSEDENNNGFGCISVIIFLLLCWWGWKYYQGRQEQKLYLQEQYEIDHFSGTNTSEVCAQNGSCYDLDVDFSNGQPNTVYFSNGGYINLGGCYDMGTAWSCSDNENSSWTVSKPF
jgi:hypothetical protein